MTAKQILDSFSETLMQDERILSPRERELLLSVLQNAKAVSAGNPETQSAVTAAISRSVGETVAQRAFALLGGSIVEQIVAHNGMAVGGEETIAATMHESGGPEPPSQGPQPPGVRRPPLKDHPKPEPQRGPEPPSPVPGPGVRRPPSTDEPAGPEPPSAPQPPGHGLQPLTVQQGARQRQLDSASVGILDEPAVVRAQAVVLDEFLAPQELDELIRYSLEHEAEFQPSAVISPSGDPENLAHGSRADFLEDSVVTYDLASHAQQRPRWHVRAHIHCRQYRISKTTTSAGRPKSWPRFESRGGLRPARPVVL